MTKRTLQQLGAWIACLLVAGLLAWEFFGWLLERLQ